MPASALLNFEFLPNPNSKSLVLTFIHGLFGDLNSLDIISNSFMENYSLLKVDLPNHGNSFATHTMNYPELAKNVMQVLQHLNITQTIAIGHSMGGKVAMTMASMYPEVVSKLVVLDIAPVSYVSEKQTGKSQEILEALKAVQLARPKTRREAQAIMQEFITDSDVQLFLLKSFKNNAKPTEENLFKFNLNTLYDQYANISAWQEVQYPNPTLFIKGSQSDYILDEYKSLIVAQFPNSKGFVVQDGDHYLHAKKPSSVINAIQHFLN